MSVESKRKHVFISHHHADDESVAALTSMLLRGGYDIRNSSIRVKPANQERLDRGLVPERVLKRLLRMKISWAGTVIVLVGKHTHQRPWVDWEIEQANKLGKRIVGVYERGGTEADLPASLEKYGSAVSAWNTEGIIRAVDGKENVFENPDGTVRPPKHGTVTSQCN